ncbi:MAG: YraN family protein [Vampirovibrionales bacterium]
MSPKHARHTQGQKAELHAQQWYLMHYPQGKLITTNWRIQQDGFRGELDFVYFTPTPVAELHFVEVKSRHQKVPVSGQSKYQGKQDALWEAAGAITPKKHQQLHTLVSLFMINFPLKTMIPEDTIASLRLSIEVCLVVHENESSYTVYTPISLF